MDEFSDIRPYDDHEVREVLDRLIADREFIDAAAKLRLPSALRFLAPLVRTLVRKKLSRDLAHIATVSDVQAYIENYLRKELKRTVTNLSMSGLEALNPNHTYLFISNHRDIAMDPALVNWVLFHKGYSTLRIAIGDNLLTKPFASDLMRINKSFIVKRGISAPRQRLKASKHLAQYIYHSVVNDGENVWIAQREGRAKNGLDKTNPALIGMLSLAKDKEVEFADFIDRLHIVPVSISYEYDPCDRDKARELYQIAKYGSYTKAEQEDVQSIAKGLVGFKGRVHLSFGEPLGAAHTDVDTVAKFLDDQILNNYVLQLTNCFAYELLEKKTPVIAVGEKGELFSELDVNEERNKFKAHVQSCWPSHRKTLLRGYANPVYAKLAASEK